MTAVCSGTPVTGVVRVRSSWRIHPTPRPSDARCLSLLSALVKGDLLIAGATEASMAESALLLTVLEGQGPHRAHPARVTTTSRVAV